MTAEEYFDIACKAFEKGDIEEAMRIYKDAWEPYCDDAAVQPINNQIIYLVIRQAVAQDTW